MIDITNFSSLFINMDTMISAICTSNAPQPIFRQILMNFVGIVNNPVWAKWTESVGSMPLIHWYCYSFLERIFNCFADFATDFGNGNIMSESRSIDQLNTKGFISAIKAFKAFCTQIQLHQAQMTSIIVMPSSITAYTISCCNTTQSCPPKEGASVTKKENANASTPPPPAQHHGDKRDPTTPETSDDNNSSSCQTAKKAKKGSKVDGPAKERKNIPFFFCFFYFKHSLLLLLLLL